MQLVVDTGGAVAAFDCGSGRIPTSVQLDAAGRFLVSGSVSRESGRPSTWPATYQGELSQDLLTVRVLVERGAPEGDFHLGPFSLRANDAPRLAVCR